MTIPKWIKVVALIVVAIAVLVAAYLGWPKFQEWYNQATKAKIEGSLT